MFNEYHYILGIVLVLGMKGRGRVGEQDRRGPYLHTPYLYGHESNNYRYDNQKRKLVWLGGGVGDRKEFHGKEMSCEVRAYSRKKKITEGIQAG